MNQRLMVVMVAGLLLVGAVNAQSPSSSPSPAMALLDGLGDPLPDAAVARLGTMRFKHDPAISSVINYVIFSPDGKKILSMGGRGNATIRLWDAATGQQITGPWSANNRAYSAIAFSPDSCVLAAAAGNSPGGFAIAPPAAFGQRGMTPEIVLWDIATAKPVQTLKAGNDTIEALVFADAGKTIIAAGQQMVRWWDIAQGKELRSWRPLGEEKQAEKQAPKAKGGKGPLVSAKTMFNCSLSPDGRFLTAQIGSGRAMAYINGNEVVYSPGGTGEIMGFDLTTQKVTWKNAANKAGVQNQFDMGARHAYSLDGKSVAVVAGPDQVALRNPANGKLMTVAQLPKANNDPRMANNGRQIFIDDDDEDFFYYNGIGGVQRQGTVALSGDGNTMAVCGMGGPVVLWNKDAPEAVRFIGKSGAGSGPSTAAPGTMAMMKGGPAQVANNSGPTPSAVAFSPDAKRIVVAAGSSLKVFDVATLFELTTLDGHERAVDFFAFSQDGKRLMSGSSPLAVGTNSAMVWETSTWKPVPVTKSPGGLPDNGVVSPDQTRFIGVGANNRLGVYDMKSGKLLTVLSVPANQNLKARMVFSPDSKYIVLFGSSDQGKNVERLYSVSSGKLLCVLPFLGASLEALRPMAFSADGRLVALFSRDDGLIHTFDIASGKLLHRMGTPPPVPGRTFQSNLAFTSDGRLLASWSLSDNVVRVWDIATGKQRLLFPPENQPHNRLYLAWSPDGRSLAMGDQTIKIWELATLKVRYEFKGHEGDIRAMTFSPDGRYLVSGSADTTALVWDTWVGRQVVAR